MEFTPGQPVEKSRACRVEQGLPGEAGLAGSLVRGHWRHALGVGAASALLSLRPGLSTPSLPTWDSAWGWWATWNCPWPGSCSFSGPRYINLQRHMGFLAGASAKEAACQGRRHKRRRFNPWVGKIPRRRAWQSTPLFLPGEPHGQSSRAGYSPWGH